MAFPFTDPNPEMTQDVPPWHPLAQLVLPEQVLGSWGQAHLPRPWVFTNGVFDILHRGHVTYLAQARQLGGSLIVGLNSDASARSLGKGPERPLNRELDRACVLGGLASVSAVVLFATRTPTPLIEQLRPDIYVKGGDYDMSALEEARLVRSWGGQAHALQFEHGHSTTQLVQRIQNGPVG
jgi:rfaE bifunctional protein nucleotidyltransferase chain/domain